MNLSVIARNIGIALVFNAIFMFFGVITSVIYDFDSSFSPLLLSCVITATVGFFPLIFVNNKQDINLKEGFTIVVLAWVLSCLFGMLPYVLWGGEFSLINAWFESVSGFTTTGSTILNDIEALPHGLLFWRSSTHFIGGLGVVVFMLLILPSASTFRMRLSKMEISALSKENYQFKTKRTVKVIGFVYIGMCLAEIVSLMIAGMDFFDALNHSFSTVATGGFSTKNSSIAAFDSVSIEIVITVFMLLGGLHFGLLYSSVATCSFKIFKSPIIRYYLVTVFVSIVLVCINIKANGYAYSWLDAIRHGSFQVISIASTTGFATTDTSLWPHASILVLIFMSLQCACSGSTTGGIKADRIYIWWQSVKREVQRKLHPQAVLPVKVGSTIVEPYMVADVNLYIVLYLFIIFVVSILLSMMGVDFIDSFTGSVASMGNVGPGFGSIGSLGNFSEIPVMGRLLFTFEMLLGRLEIYSLIVIFMIAKWR